MATYVIGDLQGCFHSFQALLKKIHFNLQQDELWLVGDLVNRGPESLAVLRFLMNFSGKLVCVLGNHDLHLLAVAAGVKEQRSSDTLQEILSSPDLVSLLTWLRQQKLLHYSLQQHVFMVHAGLYPFWTIKQAMQYAKEFENLLSEGNSTAFFSHMYGDVPTHWSEDLDYWSRMRFIVNVFTRMRIITADGGLDLKFKETLADIPPGAKPWFELLPLEYEKQRIVFGHWAALQGETTVPNVFALDTGCVWGKSLTAMRLEDGQKFSVAAIDI